MTLLHKRIVPFLLLICNFSFANNEVKVTSQLNSATVFASGAQLFHSANYTVKAGMTTLIIENVAPTMDPKSIQVKLNGNVILLDSKFRVYSNAADQFSGVSPLKVKQMKTMQDSLKWYSGVIRTKREELEVLNGAKQIILNNGAVRGQGKVNDSIELLQKTVEYYQKKLTEINLQIASVVKEHDKWKEKESDLSQRLVELQSESGYSKANGVAQVVVTLQSTVPVTGKIELSYMVASASWIPVYDLQSAVDDGKVNLNYKAYIRQNSGLKWENVQLTISTNNPNMNKTKPSLHPWYATFQNYRQTRNDNSKNMSTGIMYEKRESVQASPSVSYDVAEIRSVQDFTQMINHGVSAEFRIALPYTLESNNQEYTVLIRNVDLTAKYSYYVVPKMNKSAFLVAQVSKLEELNLVPGKANIYFDGGYMGETYLDPSQLDDTLRLSLGVDPNIIVRRTYLTQDKKEKIIGNYVEKTENYFIEVRNQKSNTIDVVIQDQIPISQLTEVTIELIDSGKATYNEVTGLLEWRKTIKPKQSEQIKFGFKIKHPKDQVVYY